MRAIRWILAAALLLSALPAGAADKTVGVIMSGNMGYYQEVHKAFAASLGKEGFDFRTVDTLLQMPSPDSLSWANAARKLVVAEVTCWCPTEHLRRWLRSGRPRAFRWCTPECMILWLRAYRHGT